MHDSILWATGNASIWESETRDTIDKINATVNLLAGWIHWNTTSSESDNEASARQVWADANATLATTVGQGIKLTDLGAIVDDARYGVQQVLGRLDALAALISTLEGNATYLGTWMDNVREKVATLNGSIATLKANLTAVSNLIDRSAVALLSARELLNASEWLVSDDLQRAIDSLNVSVSSAGAKSEECSQLLSNAANHTRDLQVQGAAIRR